MEKRNEILSLGFEFALDITTCSELLMKITSIKKSFSAIISRLKNK